MRRIKLLSAQVLTLGGDAILLFPSVHAVLVVGSSIIALLLTIPVTVNISVHRFTVQGYLGSYFFIG